MGSACREYVPAMVSILDELSQRAKELNRSLTRLAARASAFLDLSQWLNRLNWFRASFCLAVNKSPHFVMPYKGTLNVPLISGNGSSGIALNPSGRLAAATSFNRS